MTGEKIVELRSVRRSIAVPDGRTLLDAALDQGIAYPHGCRSGRCASGKSRLIAGEVDFLDHTRIAVSDEEKTRGFILACRTWPRTELTVTWLGGEDGGDDMFVTLEETRLRSACSSADHFTSTIQSGAQP